MPKKTLILIRHAHRDKRGGSARDNGLSKKGREQAKLLGPYYRHAFGNRRAYLVSSPKLRCIETLLPLITRAREAIRTAPVLDEGGDLQAKAAVFARWWKKTAPPMTVICTHGDWIPAFLQLLTGAAVTLKKGGWAELEFSGREVRLVWVVQDLKR